MLGWIPTTLLRDQDDSEIQFKVSIYDKDIERSRLYIPHKIVITKTLITLMYKLKINDNLTS